MFQLKILLNLPIPKFLGTHYYLIVLKFPSLACKVVSLKLDTAVADRNVSLIEENLVENDFSIKFEKFRYQINT